MPFLQKIPFIYHIVLLTEVVCEVIEELGGVLPRVFQVEHIGRTAPFSIVDILVGKEGKGMMVVQVKIDPKLIEIGFIIVEKVKFLPQPFLTPENKAVVHPLPYIGSHIPIEVDAAIAVVEIQ
jgi:hypothetical protein